MKLIVLNGNVDFKSLEEKFVGSHPSPNGASEQTDAAPPTPVEALKINCDENAFEIKKRLIDKRKQCVLATLADCLPNGEKVESYKFGITTQGKDEIPPDSPVVQAKTDLAEYLLIFNEHEFKNGAVGDSRFAHGNYKPRGMKLRNPVVLAFLNGFAGALGKNVADRLFGEFFDTQQDKTIKEELGELKADLREMLEEMKLENFTDTLIATRSWLRDDYSVRQANYVKTPDQNKSLEKIKEFYNDLKSRQEAMFSVVSIMEDGRIPDSSLYNCDYLTRARVLLYAATATLRTILLKEQIYWSKEYSRLAKDPYDPSNEEIFNKFIKHVPEKINYYISCLQNGRYGKIWGLQRKDNYSCHYSPGTRSMECTGGYWFEWGDTFSSGHPSDPFRGDQIFSKVFFNKGKKDNEEDVRRDTQNNKDAHFNDVRRLFEDHIAKPLGEVNQQFLKTTLLA